MRGTYRGIFSALVDDPDFQRLSARARHVFLTLRVCPQVGPAGIFRYYPAILTEQTGLDLEEIDKALTELSAGQWILREGPILWLRNALRHDPYIRPSDPKHRKTIERWVSGLPKLDIVLSFCDYYGITRPFEDPAKTHGRPRQQEKEKEKDSQKDSQKEQEEEEHEGEEAGDGSPAPPLSLSRPSSKPTPTTTPPLSDRFSPFPDTYEAWERQQQAKARR